jgi:hypothetical protein
MLSFTHEDQVKLFADFELKYFPSRIIQLIKSIIYKKRFKRFSKIKNIYRG